MKNLRYILAVAMLPLILCGCNQEDDIMEIFVSGKWQLVNYYSGGNWDDWNKPGRPKYTTQGDLQQLLDLSITFKDDGTFEGTLSGGTFSGKWSANPDDRSFSISDNVQTSIQTSGKNAEFINTLKLVKYYKGDSNLLQLAPQERTTFMQLRHLD